MFVLPNTKKREERACIWSDITTLSWKKTIMNSNVSTLFGNKLVSSNGAVVLCKNSVQFLWLETRVWKSLLLPSFVIYASLTVYLISAFKVLEDLEKVKWNKLSSGFNWNVLFQDKHTIQDYCRLLVYT